ncbi:MAG TPA: molybdopterin-binding protein [Xanthobacteraceae bacterium]|nr:molybdopterin-binding protein [Xanthobacteraceae bacterium]
MEQASQRIKKLAPLGDVLHKIDALAAPVKPRESALAEALGGVLAEEVKLSAAHPAEARALIDGFALRAEEIADAGPYAPVKAKATWLEAGEKLPPDTDAVLPPDAMNENGEATAPAGAGEGVWPAGADGRAGGVLGRAGEKLRAGDIAALEALGVKSVSLRVPKIFLAQAGGKADGPAVPLIARMIAASGGEAEVGPFDAAFGSGAGATVVIGGSGMGKSDASVTALGKKGRVEFHGVGLRPGETTALGTIDARPVLIVPGRLDAALSAFSVLGLHLIAKLAGRTHYISPMPVKLARKVASQVGLAEFVPLERLSKSEAAPLATGTIPISSLARMDGWLLVPAESEGYPAGTSVEMRLFP